MALFFCASLGAADKTNVLFIAGDDLRPQMGCYGNKLAITPNMDKLAKDGIIFDRAYCQQALCSPSRISLLTGRRPDTTKVYNLTTKLRKALPDVVTLPQQFKQAGYHAQSIGKIYHPGADDSESWSVEPYPASLNPAPTKSEDLTGKKSDTSTGSASARQSRKGKRAAKKKNDGPGSRGPSWLAPDTPDAELRDGQMTGKAVHSLRALKDQPFFLAVGFHKPHLPFIAPRKYHDLYKDTTFTVASNPYPPEGVPDIAMTTFGELRRYRDIPSSGPLSEKKALELIRAYHAAMSFTDAQIGLVLDELDRLNLRKKTAIVLWGDHGWQLGEHGLWCKHTNFETATRAPLIVSLPGKKHAGTRSNALVEFVDIYPTLSEICGLPAPEGVEGISLVPLLGNPDQPWKKAAFSQYPRAGGMGHTMRTDRYRYTEWKDKFGDVIAKELYDHESNPAENINIAGKADQKETLEKLGRQMSGGWKAQLPVR